MNGEFDVKADPERNLLIVRLAGFFSLEEVAAYHAEVHRASCLLTPPVSDQRMICDISGMRIQTQEAVAAFAQVMSDPRYRTRKVGFVVASSLARMQLLRIIGNRDAQCFTSRDEAEAWVFGVRETVRTA